MNLINRLININLMLTITLVTDLDKNFAITALLATPLMHLILLKFLKTANAPSLSKHTPKDLGLCQLKEMGKRDKVTMNLYSGRLDGLLK
jgi:hypothetical protein